jgi:hypothetical protein
VPLLLCLLLETADPVLITVGAMGGLLPDIWIFYEYKDPRLLQEVGDLNLPVFINQIGLLYISN